MSRPGGYGGHGDRREGLGDTGVTGVAFVEGVGLGGLAEVTADMVSVVLTQQLAWPGAK